MLVVPHHIAEGDTGKPASTAMPETPAPAPSASARPAKDYGSLPDPEPTESAEQWEYVVRFKHGELGVERVTHHVLPQPRQTQRTMGRFAFELWIGHELLERVRFNFPLLGAPVPESSESRIGKPIEFESGLDATQTVWIPDLKRATRAQIVDRATGDILVLPWPPHAPLSPQEPSKSE